MALVKTNLNLFWYSCALSEVAQCIAVIEQAHIGCTTWISACMRWLDKKFYHILPPNFCSRVESAVSVVNRCGLHTRYVHAKCLGKEK